MDDLLIHFGGAVKAIDGNGRVGGYLVRFGSASERDTSDEYFTAETYLGPTDGNGSESLFHHGQPVVKGLEHLADRTFAPISTKRDEIGIWAETVLDMADDYERKVFELAQKGKLGWSSGSAPHRVKKMRDGRITSWPICEGSLTPEPAEPRNKGGILPLKSLRSITMGTKADEIENKPEEKTDEKPEEAKNDECMASIAKSLDMLAKNQQSILSFLKSMKDADGDNDGDATASRKDDTAAAEEEEATARKAEDEEEATAAKAEEESDKEFDEEYKRLSPAEKAMIDRELADIAKIQAETRRWNELKANHQRRLWNAAHGRGLLR